MKINYKKSLKFVTLLIASLLIATVSAAAYVTLQWTTTTSVVANPKVCFIKWSDSSKVNSFDYAVNIFPSIRTIDENITYGITDWDAGTQTVYMRIFSITTNTNIANVTTLVKDGGTTIITVSWVTAGTLPTTWQSFSAVGAKNYTIWTEILATSGATGSSVITYELKVANP